MYHSNSGIDSYSGYNVGSALQSKYSTAVDDSLGLKGIFKPSVGRPATGLQRLLDKITLVSGLSSSFSSSMLPDSGKSDIEVDFPPCVVAAKKLKESMVKVKKQEQYLMQLYDECLTLFNLWGDKIADSKPRTILKESALLFRSHVNGLQQLSGINDEIANSLQDVADKEKSLTKLRETRVNIKQNQRKSAAKHGQTSTNVRKDEEALETNAAHLMVHQVHYIKAICERLRGSMISYAQALCHIGVAYENDASAFAQEIEEKRPKEKEKLVENYGPALGRTCARCTYPERSCKCRRSSSVVLKKSTAATRLDEVLPLNLIYENQEWN